LQTIWRVCPELQSEVGVFFVWGKYLRKHTWNNTTIRHAFRNIKIGVQSIKCSHVQFFFFLFYPHFSFFRSFLLSSPSFCQFFLGLLFEFSTYGFVVYPITFLALFATVPHFLASTTLHFPCSNFAFATQLNYCTVLAMM